VIGLVLVAASVAVALVLARRRPPASPVRDGDRIPRQLHRGDFPDPGAPWLVVLFTSSTCDSCKAMAPKVDALSSSAVATCEIEYTAHRDLHERYGIEAVPLVLVADDRGEVRASFEGPTTATDLWAAVAEVRAQVE
jgi:thiol-disulfide isomerase/thioredoxin